MSLANLVTQYIVQYGFRIMGAILVVVAALFVAKSVGRLFERWLNEQDLEHTASPVASPPRHLAGFLRLSLPGPNAPRSGLADLEGGAIIREVHVYGQSLVVGGEENGAAQHSGLGRRLVGEAQSIAGQAGFQRLAVIAAIGTRPYYLRLGFERGERYLTKSLLSREEHGSNQSDSSDL